MIPRTTPPAVALPPVPPVHIRPKLGKNVLGCALGLGMVVIPIASLVLFAIAETGVIHLPFFSRWYRGPVPARLVAAEPMTTEAFRVLIGSRFLSQVLANRGAYTQTSTTKYLVRVSEKELTGVVMNAIDLALRDGRWRQVYTQLVARPWDLELFSQFERGLFHVHVMLHFVPRLTPEGIVFDPVSIQIGDYHVPPKIAYRAMSYVFSRDLGTWSGTVGEAKIRHVYLQDGFIQLEADR